jgi:hypothetical protein
MYIYVFQYFNTLNSVRSFALRAVTVEVSLPKEILPLPSRIVTDGNGCPIQLRLLTWFVKVISIRLFTFLLINRFHSAEIECVVAGNLIPLFSKKIALLLETRGGNVHSALL